MLPWPQVSAQIIAPIATGTSDTNMAPGAAQTPGIGIAFDDIERHYINTAPSCGRTKDPDMALGISPGPDDNMTPEDTCCWCPR
ncbi:hypothetical protein NN561_014070 [Cricetulus griseus]